MAKKQLLFPLLLLLIFTLFLVGCGDEDEPVITTQGTTAAESTTAALTTTPEITTTETPVTTEDPYAPGTPGLLFEPNNDGTAKVVGIMDKLATEIRSPQHTPDGYRVIEIAYGAFQQNTVIETVIIPKTVFNVGSGAFYGCTSLKAISLAEGVETINAAAFQGCSSLESVNFPSTMTELSPLAFAGCTSLRYLTVAEGNSTYTAEGNCLLLKRDRTLYLGCVGSKIPKNVTKIDDFAFYGMGLQELLMPDSIVSVGKQAFALNTDLSVLVLSESLKTLDDLAFYSCNALTEVYLPASLETIGITPFRSCSSISRFVVSADNDKYYAKDLCLVKKEGAVLIQGFVGATIPASVQTIGEYAFALMPIHEMTIPEGVTAIDKFAFAYCNGLRTLSLPKSLTSIASDAFYNATVIETISFGGDKRSFDILTADVTLPEKVTVTYKE